MLDLQQRWEALLRAWRRAPPEEPPPPAVEEPRRLGLALGGGGGKGAAHLGVLQAMEELAIPIDVIVGTSAGGAVAMLYAMGMSIPEIREVFRNTALRRIAIPDPTRTGLIGQRKREEYLTRLLGERTFAELRIPCAVVATDLASGHPVLLHEGPLLPAILATTALPSIFPPVIRGDQILADGGILNNLPVDAAEILGAQRVIAVELTDALPGFSLSAGPVANPLARLTLAPQQFAIASRALSLLMARATELHLRDHPPALLIQPNVADIPTLDMSNPERGQSVGLEAARAAAEELLALRAWRTHEPAVGGGQIWEALKAS